MNKITFDDRYTRRLTYALSQNTNTTCYWKMAIGMKLEQDKIIESGDPGYWNYYYPIETKAAKEYIPRLKEQLSKTCGNAFKGIKHSRTCQKTPLNDKETYYSVAFSNFHFTLCLRTGRDKKTVPYIYCYRMWICFDAYLHLGRDLEGLAAWLLKENEEMPAFRTEWDNLCFELRKQVKNNTLDENVVRATLSNMLTGCKTDYSIQTGFGEQGRFLEMSCPPLDILFHIPIDYADWRNTVELFADFIKKR